MAHSLIPSYYVTVLLISYCYCGKGVYSGLFWTFLCVSAVRPSPSAWMGPAGNSASPWRQNTECGNPQSQHCFALSAVFIYSFCKLGLFWGNVEVGFVLRHVFWVTKITLMPVGLTCVNSMASQACFSRCFSVWNQSQVLNCKAKNCQNWFLLLRATLDCEVVVTGVYWDDGIAWNGDPGSSEQHVTPGVFIKTEGPGNSWGRAVPWGMSLLGNLSGIERRHRLPFLVLGIDLSVLCDIICSC